MKLTKIAAVSVLVLCVLLAVASAGCTGNNTQNVVGNVSVIADSKLTAPMDDIVKAFDKKYPKVTISITYGESSEIAPQIIAGTLNPNNFVSTDATSINDIVKANLSSGYTATTLPYNVMIDTATNEMGAAFLNFMKSPDGKAIFKSYGYTTST